MRQAETEIRRYELWRPIIRPRRRIALERMHQNIAESWSRRLADFLPRGERIEFEGLDFESFARLSEADGGNSQTALFAIEKTEIGGFLLISAELARCLVESRLGIGGTSSKSALLTRIDMVILREATSLLLASLGAAYAASGVGELSVTRHNGRLKDTLLFGPQDYLLVLRFRIGAPGSPLRMAVATSGDMINAIKDMAVTAPADGGSARTERAAGTLPIDLDLVLGTWNVALGRLFALKPGDRIVLPDGSDAWLAAHGVPVRRAAAELNGRRTKIEIR